ncbi:hypothetical protein DFQ28_009869 [Apophysomyces sp. BC1034]|nr:hypothetical protein DFQ30_009429 [Apophysomyces sp. BC1015]KAG0181599.1 hypothetical protein DFQ29_007859 [Apophysomyces sp. BC1021]KAG0192196.1 hypothetical protein DFQ28_009869 [Apophysomyces sp. BC1034]
MQPTFYYNQSANSPGVAPPLGAAGRPFNPAQMAVPPGHYMQAPPFRNGPPMHDPAAMHRKRAVNKPSRPGGMPLAEEADEPSGDELDDISARDIAMARYKRNHDYLSEIFTPYNADAIVPPPLDISHSKEELTKLIDEHEVRMKAQKTSHERRVEELEQERRKFWTLLKELSGAPTLEVQQDAADNSSNQLAQLMGVKIEHTMQQVTTTPIPGVEEDVEPSMTRESTQRQRHEENKDYTALPQPNDFVQSFMNANARDNCSNDMPSTDAMDMFSTFSRDGQSANQAMEETDNDFMFNEMVNTGQEDDEDDPSVSEFLNADMDSDQSERGDGEEQSENKEGVNQSKQT